MGLNQKLEALSANLKGQLNRINEKLKDPKQTGAEKGQLESKKLILNKQIQDVLNAQNVQKDFELNQQLDAISVFNNKKANESLPTYGE